MYLFEPSTFVSVSYVHCYLQIMRKEVFADDNREMFLINHFSETITSFVSVILQVVYR